MGKLKYKLKEASQPPAIKGAKVGDVKVDNGIKSTITDIDSETGAISWDVDYVPNIGELVNDVNELTNTSKEVAVKAKNDPKFRDIYNDAKSLRNKIRTHVRNNYPEEYRKAMGVAEEVTDEISTSGGAGSYQTPFAFNKNKKADGTDDDVMVKKYGYKLAPVEEGPGATFGPGPAAGPEGVKDNMYVKKFKYKLVPPPHDSKTIAIVDLSKGKTTPLNEADINVEEYINDLGIESSALKKHITSRVLGFDKVENKLNELIPLLAQAKIKTMDYYKEKPDFKVVYGTDLAVDYLDDLIEMFKD
jgi:hypothetical protein